MSDTSIAGQHKVEWYLLSFIKAPQVGRYGVGLTESNTCTGIARRSGVSDVGRAHPSTGRRLFQGPIHSLSTMCLPSGAEQPTRSRHTGPELQHCTAIKPVDQGLQCPGFH